MKHAKAFSGSYDRKISIIKSIRETLSPTTVNEALLLAIRDRDELVRIEAAEALAYSGGTQVLTALWRAMSDESPLVRSYIATAIGVIGTTGDAKRLKRLLTTEDSDEARLGIYIGLAWLRDAEGVTGILALLNSSYYRARCAAANNVIPFVNGHNRGRILRALKTARRKEQTVAAKEALERSIRTIDR